VALVDLGDVLNTAQDDGRSAVLVVGGRMQPAGDGSVAFSNETGRDHLIKPRPPAVELLVEAL
jgi:hypothetical protein